MTQVLPIVCAALGTAVLILLVLLLKGRKRQQQLLVDGDRQRNEAESLKARYASVISIDSAVAERTQQVSDAAKDLKELQEKYQAGMEIFTRLRGEIDLFTDTLDLRESGVYQPQFSFDTSEQFKARLEANYEMQKQAVKSGVAATCKTEWQVGGSIVEGMKMTERYKKLMLFAFNGECDGLIAKVRWNNALKMSERVAKAFETINKLGSSNQTVIEQSYLQLKLEELALTYEYEAKKQAEKEEQRRIREQMREEERAQRELERAQREAEDEEKRFEKALEKAKKQLGVASASELIELQERIRGLESNLLQAHQQKERALSMAQQTKVGHIYVISNLGSLGEEVYKIGMTRRLEPLDRIRELGDASVPFQFDVHTVIFSENAPQLESELHRRFADRRVNRVNFRKEFFRVSLQEIEAAVKEHLNADIEFTGLAEAQEYRETLALLDRMKQQSVVADVPTTEAFPSSIM